MYKVYSILYIAHPVGLFNQYELSRDNVKFLMLVKDLLWDADPTGSVAGTVIIKIQLCRISTKSFFR